MNSIPDPSQWHCPTYGDIKGDNTTHHMKTTVAGIVLCTTCHETREALIASKPKGYNGYDQVIYRSYDLAGANRAYLQAICRDFGITGYSVMARATMQRRIMEEQRKRGVV